MQKFRRTPLTPLLLLGTAMLGVVTPGLAADSPRRPNIVLLVADDLGYGETGCQGNQQIPTPHIDRLAAAGVRFTNGYVTASYCSPSRAGLLTGRYQTRFGHELNPTGRNNLAPSAGLPTAERTLADALQQAGYATGLVGKWHLGGREEFHPRRRGFDEFYGFLHEGHYFVPRPWTGVTSFLRRRALPAGQMGRWIDGKTIWSDHLGYDEPPYDADNPLLRGEQPVEEPTYLTDALTREAIAFVDRHRAEPFFLCVAYNAVHSPMQGADAYMRKFAGIEDIHRRVFAAMLANLDDSVGALLAKLQKEDLEQQTLVFFLSDNGGPTRELTSSNAPLRAGKGSMYEGGLRVPMLMRWPARLPAGKTYAEPVIATDIFATAVTAAGVPAADAQTRPLDGVDLLPHLTGRRDAPPHEQLYWRMGNKSALRAGDWKIVRHGGPGETAGDWELYHLADDVSESNNLAGQQPARLRELTQRYEKLNAEMVPPVWTRSR